MKIKLSKSDLNRVLSLLQVREQNINVSTMYLYYLENEATSINTKLLSKYSSKQIEYSFYRALLNVLELDPRDEDVKQIEYDNKINNIKCLNPNKYLNNPYYKNIKVPQIKEKNWYFKYDTFLPFEGFMYKDISINENDKFQECSHLGFFKEPFKYLTITQNDDIWMSITPHEIETMEKSVLEAKGNVIVYGLGLGYYPYMISLKDEVKEITIIEIDPKAIDLFNTYLLPQFEHKEKIKVIKSDAFKFASSHQDYDYAFVDLWHNVDDGLPMYLKMKSIEKNTKSNLIYSYWIEDALIAVLRRLLLVLIDEECDGSKEENYQHEENYEDHIINRLYYVLKDYQINNYEDIHNLLKKESLIKIAREIEK